MKNHELIGFRRDQHVFDLRLFHLIGAAVRVLERDAILIDDAHDAVRLVAGFPDDALVAHLAHPAVEAGGNEISRVRIRGKRGGDWW